MFLKIYMTKKYYPINNFPTISTFVNLKNKIDYEIASQNFS